MITAEQAEDIDGNGFVRERAADPMVGADFSDVGHDEAGLLWGCDFFWPEDIGGRAGRGEADLEVERAWLGGGRIQRVPVMASHFTEPVNEDMRIGR